MHHWNKWWFSTTSFDCKIDLRVSTELRLNMTTIIDDSTDLTYHEFSRLDSEQLSTLSVSEVRSALHGTMKGDLKELKDKIKVL